MFKMALPRSETIGFRAAVHKPMGDVTDVTSISFIQSMIKNEQFAGYVQSIWKYMGTKGFLKSKKIKLKYETLHDALETTP